MIPPLSFLKSIKWIFWPWHGVGVRHEKETGDGVRGEWIVESGEWEIDN
ncbi:hypothetical protein [Desulforegula conservatrix]|nr:hypothetical protein [Desulforegula conservatrix]